MAISTNGTVLARVAGALYNTQMSNATYSEVKTLDPASLTDALYARDFANATDTAVATTLVTNLGLTSVEGLVNWVAAQLTAAGAHKGAKIVDLLNGFAQMTADATYGAAATAFNTKVDAALVLSQTTGNAGGAFAAAGSVVSGATFALTSGIDAFAGTAGSDTFDGTETSAGNATLSAMDTIDGGAGNDTLKVVDATAIDTTTITGLTVKNVEVANLTSGAAITTSTTTWTGLTGLNLAAGTDVTATAAATTDLTATAAALTSAAGAVTVNGGNNVTASAADTSTTAAASGNTILVGATTAAAGAVKVTYTETISDAAATNAGVTGSSIAVTGGATIEVNSLAVVGAASHASDVLTIGQIDATGNASTTTVVVKQTAATDAYAAAGDKIKVTNGTVNVLDANRASTTKAGTIATVTLDNFGAATVNSGALVTLNLSGKGASVDAGTLGALTTPANTALALNVNGLTTTGTVSVDTDIKTLNLASSTTASTINLLTNGATALNISGDAKVTLTGQTAVASQVITVTNTAGAVLGTELATSAKFVGGAGADSILLAATTKAQDMGDGSDVVTLSVTALGAGGSLNGGAGTDTLVANTNGSSFAADPAFGGFETLRVAGAAAQGAHNANGFTAIEAGALTGGNASFTNVAANVGLTQLATLGNDLTVTLANATGTADSINVTLKSSGAIGAAGDTITLAGIETISITTVDTNTTAHQDTVELVATSAKTVTVTGNAGLIYTNADALITSFDASGVSVPKVTDSGVTFDSTNATVGEVVTIKGSNGVDVLTGSSTAADSIYGNAGADTIAYDGGSDVYSGGAGNDVFDINALGTSTVNLTISDLAIGDTIDFDSVDVAASNDTFNATAVTLGANATLAQYLDAAAAGDGHVHSIIRWFQFGGNTYIALDNTTGATFAATDGLVKLTGLIDLSTATEASNILTIA